MITIVPQNGFFGKNLRLRREQKNLTLPEAAARLNISEEELSLIESGEQVEINSAVMDRMDALLGVYDPKMCTQDLS